MTNLQVAACNTSQQRVSVIPGDAKIGPIDATDLLGIGEGGLT